MGKQVKNYWIALALIFLQLLSGCSSSDDDTPSNGIVWYCKTPMEKAKSLVFCKMAFRGIVLYHGFDFLSLRNKH